MTKRKAELHKVYIIKKKQTGFSNVSKMMKLAEWCGKAYLTGGKAKAILSLRERDT